MSMHTRTMICVCLLNCTLADGCAQQYSVPVFHTGWSDYILTTTTPKIATQCPFFAPGPGCPGLTGGHKICCQANFTVLVLILNLGIWLGCSKHIHCLGVQVNEKLVTYWLENTVGPSVIASLSRTILYSFPIFSTLLEMIKRREKTKKELLQLTIEIVEKR
jgi:hypothetical protein